MQAKFKLPGWVAPLLVALLGAAAQFFQGEQFQGVDWAPLVVALLVLIGKSIEIGLERRAARRPDGWVETGPLRGTPVRIRVAGVTSRSQLQRWLWGG